MLVTNILLFVVMTRIWKWPLGVAIALMAVFAFIDTGFFAANIVKVFEGGWVSLAIAAVIVMTMWTWIRGSRYLFDKTRRNEIPLDFLAANLLKKKPQLVSGTAVFLTSDPVSAPTALMHSLKHYKVLHEQNVILSVVTAQQPVVPDSDRVKMEPINDLFMR
ncbi:MAG: potassium transporter Kup, partial [Mesorhizobium sp.]|uniref:KUP/HAK/KT family potassium transporter n=1 Tax=Mesorhizobium sp. TaxID=1871066 RepID=UPI000FEA59E5